MGLGSPAPRQRAGGEQRRNYRFASVARCGSRSELYNGSRAAGLGEPGENVTHPNNAKWTGSANRKAYSIFNALDGRNRRRASTPLFHQRVGTVNAPTVGSFTK